MSDTENAALPGAQSPENVERGAAAQRAAPLPFQKLDLDFPRDSGFDRTEIFFYGGEPDLNALYFSEKAGRERLFITDTNVASLCPSFVSRFTDERISSVGAFKLPVSYRAGSDVLCVIAAGEKYKTIQSVLYIVQAALDADFKRGCLFVGIGGGVISDMTAFAASMFKRGVDCEIVSTTLLSDADASIGGKSGCDFKRYKNMIGAFYPARTVHIFPSFIKTLPEREFRSGLAEVIKTAFLFSPELLAILKDNRDAVLGRESFTMEKAVLLCARAKAQIVHEDFKERGIRRFLNYGHTFGHALETVAGLGNITHGEAVAWGISRALTLSARLGRCERDFADEDITLLRYYGYDTKSIPGALEDKKDAARKLLSAMRKDKKNTSDKIKIIMQSRPFETFAEEVDDEAILEVLS